LLERVQAGTLFGYGFEDAKPGNFNAYAGNIWAAPAYAWCTSGSLKNSMDLFVRAICDAAVGQYSNKVN
jgi:hypothetical protein